MKLDCCTPYNAPYPSGHHWTHSKWCSVSPNKKVEAKAKPPTAFTVTMAQIDACPLKSLAPAHYRADGSCGCRPAMIVGGPDHDGARPEVLERLAPSAAHPACIAAATDGATPCSRCSWLLEIDNEGARYIDHHLDSGKAIR